MKRRPPSSISNEAGNGKLSTPKKPRLELEPLDSEDEIIVAPSPRKTPTKSKPRNVNGTPSKPKTVNGTPVKTDSVSKTSTSVRGTPKKDGLVPAPQVQRLQPQQQQPHSILKDSPRNTPRANRVALQEQHVTPRSERRVLFSTPRKQTDEEDEQEEENVDGEVQEEKTLLRSGGADRSARRKSNRQRIIGVTTGNGSDDELADEIALGEQILGDKEDEDEDEEQEDELLDEITVQLPAVTDTPTKRPRGRPKGKRKQRTPSPPPDLPAHERYFFENRAGGTKTSSNTLSSTLLLNHEDYFAQMAGWQDHHADSIEYLHSLHARAFQQWVFELREGFNICLYGYGSKRELAMRFATYLASTTFPGYTIPKIAVVNGYHTSINLRDILILIAACLPSLRDQPLPLQPGPLLTFLLKHLSQTKDEDPPVLLLIHSFDSPSLRRSGLHTALASLTSLPSRPVQVLATCNTPNFPLLWDVATLSKFRFLFHDATTFARCNASELDAVSTVQALLGRSGRRMSGKEGVGYVLRSLTENARGLYRLLVAEQLTAMIELDVAEAPSAGDGGVENSDDEDEEMHDVSRLALTPSKGRPKKKLKSKKKADGAERVGLEFRLLYQKAVEEFLCSSEHAFRTLLKEFYDHQMLETRQLAGGEDILFAPFRREELEVLLEEMVE